MNMKTDQASSNKITRSKKTPQAEPIPSARQSEQDNLFIEKHIGSSKAQISEILKKLKVSSLDQLIEETFPPTLKKETSFKLAPFLSESDVLKKLKTFAMKNQVFKTYIGRGYVNCHSPAVILRNILENPAWYSSYTPYQPELAQGRLEALFNFQTMISSLTGMEIANASLLDEGTALAEACSLAKKAQASPTAKKIFVDRFLFPQNLEVLKTRVQSMDLEIELGDFKNFKGDKEDYFAVVLQYPNSQGHVANIEPFLQEMKKKQILNIVSCDLLSLCLLKSPGEMGADVVVGSSQRFGIPLFFGGPHAGFFATNKKQASMMPGRLVGLSKNRHQKQALRLALQTREQHIRRERATSNICTSQVLLAIISGFYAVYHGPEGLKKISSKINNLAKKLYAILKSLNQDVSHSSFFDTVQWKGEPEEIQRLQKAFLKNKINVGRPSKQTLSITLDESTTEGDLAQIQGILQSLIVASSSSSFDSKQASSTTFDKPIGIPQKYERTSAFLTQDVFNQHHSETQLLRYIYHLQSKELSLNQSMIPLGSCTMKLNATTELMPVTWENFSNIHPFAPSDQRQGYLEMIQSLEEQLCELTGFSRFSFQPNSGAQGEYAGLLAIQKYQQARGESKRNICLIPTSAHGTNPASATLAGLKVVSVQCTKEGHIHEEDLKEKLQTYGDRVSSMMITYPSTYGIFENKIPQFCKWIHEAGGLVYLDGANMNAMLGLSKPANIGFDVCHLNLHKTFCIPHGGGGPGSGPIGVVDKLKDFLPPSDFLKSPDSKQVGFVSSSPFGNAGILMIPWTYISLMGYEGLKLSGQMAIANANYIKERLSQHYSILFKGAQGRVAHECIVDFRKFRHALGITVEDVAKRLMDYGFHAPTMSWPVVGTLMIEPTESESKEEIDRFCDAMISIKKELDDILNKKLDKNLFKNAPHTIEDLTKESWDFSYTKERAFYPLPWLKEKKFWPASSRVEQAYGDINLSCSC